jgi:hypothetical protein
VEVAVVTEILAQTLVDLVVVEVVKVVVRQEPRVKDFLEEI